MLDGCTDAKRSLYNFLMNSPKGTVLLSSFNTSEISKIAGKVFDTLDEIVERAGEENVIQVAASSREGLAGEGGGQSKNFPLVVAQEQKLDLRSPHSTKTPLQPYLQVM
jgi:hypothetical protein